MICFELSMPSNNSWNGKWSGAGNCYAIIKNFGNSKKTAEREAKIIDDGDYYYNFGDGWTACVSARKVDAKEATKIRKKSRGFLGYNWMVDSILKHGEIIAEPRPQYCIQPNQQPRKDSGD